MPSILKKILRITGKVMAWILGVYLVLGFIIIPFAAAWAIRTQGLKYTSHTVQVKSVWLNPLSLSLVINGFDILDKDKKVMVGFQKFFVNISFMSLLKKIYRVEDVSLTGFQIHAALLPDGAINLMGLVPKEQAGAKQGSSKTEPLEKPAGKPEEKPVVIVDKIQLVKGDVSFTDQTVNPNFYTTLNNINVTITGLTTDPGSLVRVVMNALLDNKGAISTEAQVKPWVQPLDLETVFSLDQYVMTVLTPYVGKYTGRELAQGKLDFKTTYRISGNQLTASHKILIQHFEFGKKVESKDALGLPFGLAVALLEDPSGRIAISLPVKGDMSDPKFEYWHLVGQVARNFFMKLVTKPFSILASVVGGGDSGTDEMSYVRFVTGKAEVSSEDQEKLKIIIAGLKQRPKLALEINGSYDPEADWKAIKTEVFYKSFEDLKKETTKTESWVYRQLYQRRFGVRALWDLVNAHQRKGVDIDNDPQLNAEIKRQLIEDAPPDKLALDVLAQTRAKMIYDLIVTSGFDEKRLSIGANKPIQSAMGLVPLEFTLTVFGESAEPKEAGIEKIGDGK